MRDEHDVDAAERVARIGHPRFVRVEIVEVGDRYRDRAAVASAPDVGELLCVPADEMEPVAAPSVEDRHLGRDGGRRTEDEYALHAGDLSAAGLRALPPFEPRACRVRVRARSTARRAFVDVDGEIFGRAVRGDEAVAEVYVPSSPTRPISSTCSLVASAAAGRTRATCIGDVPCVAMIGEGSRPFGYARPDDRRVDLGRVADLRRRHAERRDVLLDRDETPRRAARSGSGDRRRRLALARPADAATTASAPRSSLPLQRATRAWELRRGTSSVEHENDDGVRRAGATVGSRSRRRRPSTPVRREQPRRRRALPPPPTLFGRASSTRGPSCSREPASVSVASMRYLMPLRGLTDFLSPPARRRAKRRRRSSTGRRRSSPECTRERRRWRDVARGRDRLRLRFRIDGAPG